MGAIRQAESKLSDTQKAHRSKLLYDATIQFCNQRGSSRAMGVDQFTKLFYSLIGETDFNTKKLISARLARKSNTPRTVAYCLAMEPIEIAAPFLLISPVFWERDLMQLARRLDAPHLSILARRSDISPAVALELFSRGSNFTRKAILDNPAIDMKNVAQMPEAEADAVPGDNNISPDVAPRDQTDDPKENLMKLANAGGRGVKKTQTHEDKRQQNPTPGDEIGASLLSHAKAGNQNLVIGEITNRIGMEFDEVKKMVLHGDATSFVILLKGIGLSQGDASQLLALVNNFVARDFSELRRCMRQFDRFSGKQCRDIMRNLGAKFPSVPLKIAPSHSETLLQSAAIARRRQIMLTKAPVLFGSQKAAKA